MRPNLKNLLDEAQNDVSRRVLMKMPVDWRISKHIRKFISLVDVFRVVRFPTV